jgi:hypothetical protein
VIPKRCSDRVQHPIDIPGEAAFSDRLAAHPSTDVPDMVLLTVLSCPCHGVTPKPHNVAGGGPSNSSGAPAQMASYRPTGPVLSAFLSDGLGAILLKNGLADAV